MIDGGDDKTGVGESTRGILMAIEGTAPAVGEDHQRQLVAVDRTILLLRARSDPAAWRRETSIAPFSAGPLMSAGTSIIWMPAASAGIVNKR